MPYLQNVTVNIPNDTVTSLGTFHYSHVDLQASATNYGLPGGLSLTGTPSTLKFPGNASSCMLIYGTPSDVKEGSTVQVGVCAFKLNRGNNNNSK